VSGDDPVILARTLTRVFGAGEALRRAVDDVSLTVQKGEVVLIFGPSGCGKSTLLSLLGGLDRDYSGSLTLFGRDVARLSDVELSRLRGEKIGFIFQAFHLLGHLSVLENVMAPALFSRETAQETAVNRRAHETLERVGLLDRAASRPAELSGGQRQRVAIARALLHEPTLLLCDEPTGNLDRKTGEQIIDLFASLHADLRATILIVTHEDRLARLAHRTLDMVDGKLAASATRAPSEVVGAEA
jgi:ABC-type lipoprotein export system ATPase subunit